MRLRFLGCFLVVAATAFSSGCIFCRPFGWHCHKCCYQSASTEEELDIRGEAPARQASVVTADFH
jgi:hypothetical protein